MLGWGWLPTHVWLKQLVCNKYSTSPAAFGSETLTSYASFHGFCRSKSCTPIMPPSATVNDLQQLHQNFQHAVICCIKLNLIWSLRESKRFLAEISPYFSFPWGFLCFRDLSSHIRANAMLQNLLGNGTSNTNLYVAGLPPSTSEEMMRQLFKEFGDVPCYEGKMCWFCWDHRSWAYCAKHLASMCETQS